MMSSVMMSPEREFMKRYFSDLVDLYPEDAASFIKAREDAKRLRKDADEAETKLKKEMGKMFDLYDNEPHFSTELLLSFPASSKASPAKK